MVVKLSNLGVAVNDSKNRIILLIIFVAVSFTIGLGIYEFKHRVEKGVPSDIRLSVAPKVESIPGVDTESREYIKLQREQNIQQVQQAQHSGASTVPTIVRESYLGTDDLAQGFNGEASTGTAGAAVKGCDLVSLRRARLAGVSAFELRCRGCSASALRDAGYTAGELRAAGYSARDLKKAGFNAAELKEAGYTPSELKQADFTPGELQSIGVTQGELKEAGYTPGEAGKACDIQSLTQAHQQGVSASELKQRGCDALSLKEAGYTAKELKAAGYTASELSRAGFDAAEIKKAGFDCSIESLRRARDKGVLVSELRQRHCGAAALRAAGYTAGELRDAGFTANELKAAGFTAAALKAAGFDVRQLKAAGFSPEQLQSAGFTADQLKAAGFTAGELNRGGFTAAQLKAAGYTASQLRNAGYSAGDLKEAGFSADQLKSAGYTQGDLVRAGIASTMEDNQKSEGEGTSASQSSDAVASQSGDANQNSAAIDDAAQAGGGTGSSVDDADAKLEALKKRQAQQILEQESKANLEVLKDSMSSSAGNLISTWAPPPVQNYVQGQPPKTQQAGASAVTPGEGVIRDGMKGQAVGSVDSNMQVIKAGTIMFAVLETSINSDEPSPVLATIVGGPLKGARLIGQFKQPNSRAGRVLVTFTRMSLSHMTRSITLNAVALDANTAHTAIADYVNHHYALRYGTLILSSVFKGIGQAVVQSGSTSNFSQFGVQVSHEKLSNEKILLAGLGEAGQKYSESLHDNFTTPTTVRVFAGTPIGVLYMQDLSIPAILEDKN